MATMTTKPETRYELQCGRLYVDGVLGAADPEAVSAAVDAWNAGETERLDPSSELLVVSPELAMLILHVAQRMAARPEGQRLPRAAVLVQD